MKTSATIFCFIVMLTTGFSQVTWYHQYSPVNNPLYQVYFTDQDNGWIAGGSSTMLYSVSGGYTWGSQSIPPSDAYYSVFFSDGQHGWASGFQGRVSHTINGGQNWSIQISTTNNDLFSICFLDNNEGWIAGGSYGDYPPFIVSRVIIHTSDGGDTWFTQYSEQNRSPLRNIKMLNSTTGFAVAEDGYLLYTTDGGQAWNEKVINVAYLIHDMCFVNTTTGYVAGENLALPLNGGVLKTTDGGDNWTEQPLGIKEVPQSIYFIDVNNGWIVGKDSLNEPIIYYTTNGGSSWISQTPPDNTSALNDVFFTDATTGWAVGDDGTIISSMEGVVGIDDNPALNDITGDIALGQNYPNPFTGETRIDFRLTRANQVSLIICDMLGQPVRTLVDEMIPSGDYSFTWDGTTNAGIRAAAGIYLIRLQAGNEVQTKQMSLAR